MNFSVHSGYKVENLLRKLQTTCLRFSLNLYDSTFISLQNETVLHVISKVNGSKTFMLHGPAKHQFLVPDTMYVHVLRLQYE
jgi:hypothetical protein